MKDTSVVGRRKRRIRRSREEIALLLEDYNSSGLSQRAYAESKGLSLSTLGNWLKLSRLEGDPGTRPRLVPVKIVDRFSALGPVTAGGFELSFPGGLRLSIPPDFQENALRRLLPLVWQPC